MPGKVRTVEQKLEEGVLSGLAAAHLFGLIKGTAPPPEVSARTARKIKGVRTRRRRLHRSDRTVWRGIPTTTLPRTVIDLASYTYGDVTERAESVLTELRPLLTPPESRAASCSP